MGSDIKFRIAVVALGTLPLVLMAMVLFVK
jgi:hypothetical protein